MFKSFIFKIVTLISALMLICAGISGWTYYSFQTSYGQKISAKNLHGALALIGQYEANPIVKIIKNFPGVKQDISFKKGWILAETGSIEEAVKKFREASEKSLLNMEAQYNATTLSLMRGRDSLDKLAEEYIKILGVKPDDFQTKINLEIIRLLQQQKKNMAQQQSGQSNEKEKNKKQHKMRESEEGTGSPEQGTRY